MSIPRRGRGGLGIESARLIAGLARVTQDIGLAEELAQDSLVSASAVARIGRAGHPGAWLMAVGKRRAVDIFRRKGPMPARSPSSAGT